MIGNIIGALCIVIWTVTNDRDVAAACARPERVPWMYIVMLAFETVIFVINVIDGEWFDATVAAVIAAMCIRVIWHWWRRRRQGKPARVFAKVKDVGHKLSIVPVVEGPS